MRYLREKALKGLIGVIRKKKKKKKMNEGYDCKTQTRREHKAPRQDLI